VLGQFIEGNSAARVSLKDIAHDGQTGVHLSGQFRTAWPDAACRFD
jgi:hypothetical protein